MTQENKDLLLQDMCARLPYGVVIQEKCIEHDEMFLPSAEDNKLVNIDVHEGLVITNGGSRYHIEEFKPYLFPLSSMTEEQFMELKVFADLTYEGNTLELVEWNDNYKTLEFWLEEIPSYCVIKVFDWLNKNHFDFRDLISKELAIDATNLNIY